MLKLYLRSRARVVMVAALFSAIFFATFALYRLPLAAVAYPTALCAAIGLLLLAHDYYVVRRRHLIFQSLRPELLPELPRAGSVLEADYLRLLDLLNTERQRSLAELSRRYTDTLEYYTLWAHQIKSPIASMRLQLQKEDTPFSARMQSELLRIEQYVEMVMTFLRLDASGTDYVLREYDLDEIVRQAVRRFSGEFIGRGIVLQYDALHVRVLTDEKWLLFVIEQLLSNALKYTPQGSITISLKEEKRLCIRDTGIGIAPEDIPRVFEKGYTGYNGRADKRASGIGLYLCRRICGNLGHALTCESVPGKGTTVCIDLSDKPRACD